MGTYEATNVVITRINNLDPQNASKIIGHILVNLQDTELIRLASTPDYVLHSLVLRVKTLLGLSSTPSSPNPIPKPPNTNNPFSRFTAQPFCFNNNNNPISPNSTSLIPLDNIHYGSVSKSSLSPRVMMGERDTGRDVIDHQQMNDYFSFLNESLKDEDFADPNIDLGHGIVNNGDSHFHRRSYSTGDVYFGSEEIGYKPCLYFAKGFCKNGSNCKFLHSDLTDSVGSPSRFDGLEQHEEIIRHKAAQHQRLKAHLMAEASPSSYDKCINFLMHQQSDSQRAAAAAVMMGDEFHKFGRCRPERNDFLAMLSAEKHNPSSRQIYLTFPAESTFKDEDVSEYFSKFGPVQDVRIPYQQKRMFGFVTFVYPETVRLILSKGNPHFICDSRVLVKPYKEKGKLLDKKQQQQQPQLERGEFSPCLSPSGLDSKEPCDFHLGARMFYNPHEILLRRKMEEQAELQQAIELQERRLMNLQLPDFKNIPIRRGASLPLTQLHSHISNPGFSGNPVSSISLEPQQEVDPAGIHDTDSGNGKESTGAEIRDPRNSVESGLPDSLSASPTKAGGDNLSDFSTLAEVNESAVFSTSLLNKLEPQTTFSDMASH